MKKARGKTPEKGRIVIGKAKDRWRDSRERRETGTVRDKAEDVDRKLWQKRKPA